MVVAHDHLGHGESVSSKKDWGYMAEGHPSDILVKDMHTPVSYTHLDVYKRQDLRIPAGILRKNDFSGNGCLHGIHVRNVLL